jgi:1-acyl-sn-glycerol-3-phosphate acyltransferase
MLKLFCTLLFKASGWKFVDKVPKELRSFVFIGAPHTSNFDIVPVLAVSYLMKRNAHFVIKKEWLKFPFGPFFKSLGAIGINRNSTDKLKAVSQTDVIAELFTNNPEFVLMISPEGTRSLNKTWKTGFYYIAQKAKVPLVLGFADYKTKTAGLGLVIYPEDLTKDMTRIMDFYKGMEGKFPEKFQLDERYLEKME